MPTPTKPTDEQTVLRAIWRKALATGEHRINLKSIADCHRVRFALYNAVRAVRKGLLTDPELLRATKELIIRVEGTTVLLLRRDSTSEMQALLESLGPDGAELLGSPAPKSAVELEVEDSQARFLEQLKKELGPEPEAGSGARSTPYYTR